MFKNMTHKSMSTFVVGNGAPFLFGHNAALLFWPSYHALHSLFYFVHTNYLLMTTRCKKCSFIQKIGQISARKSRRQFCKCPKPHIGCKWFILSMNLKNGFSAFNIGGINLNTSIKTTRAQKCWVQNVRTISCSNKNNCVTLCKTIHFYQQLIKRLFALIMTTANSSSTLTANRIYFVDKNNGRSCMFCLLKEVANTRSAYANKHFNKI